MLAACFNFYIIIFSEFAMSQDGLKWLDRMALKPFFCNVFNEKQDKYCLPKDFHPVEITQIGLFPPLADKCISI